MTDVLTQTTGVGAGAPVRQGRREPPHRFPQQKKSLAAAVLLEGEAETLTRRAVDLALAGDEGPRYRAGDEGRSPRRSPRGSSRLVRGDDRGGRRPFIPGDRDQRLRSPPEDYGGRPSPVRPRGGPEMLDTGRCRLFYLCAGICVRLASDSSMGKYQCNRSWRLGPEPARDQGAGKWVRSSWPAAVAGRVRPAHAGRWRYRAAQGRAGLGVTVGAGR